MNNKKPYQNQDFDAFQSPFAWRYASEEMRKIWSETTKRVYWRRIWLIVAEAQSKYGLVSPEQLEDLRVHHTAIDIPRALEIEKRIHHDVMSEVLTFAEQCEVGGGVIHLGMTSTDVTDNADIIRVRDSLDLVLRRIANLLGILCDRIDHEADTPVIGFTHLQPAEPTTLGYRLSQYAQDLLMDWENIFRVRKNLRGKGVRGAVGTSASFAALIGQENLVDFEREIGEALNMTFFPITNQTYPRKQDYDLLCALAGLGGSLNKFGYDLRLLQMPTIGELAEPFGSQQVGSSAMPFKRNPIQAEKINSLARQLAQFPRVAWDNSALNLLERTLDDSANRRSILPEAFLIADEVLITITRILNGLQVNKEACSRNLRNYAPFAAIEPILMAVSKMGADRQEMHERLREHALSAWEAVKKGYPNPLFGKLKVDPQINKNISDEDLDRWSDVSRYIGDAPDRARAVAQMIRLSLRRDYQFLTRRS